MANQYTRPDEAERFWAKVDQSAGADACWPWTAARFWFGHGAFKRNGRPWGAHRIALEMSTNQSIPPTLDVLHHCDNPPCCNPAHLYIGTQRDNSRDMMDRGRGRFGELHPHAKLTAADVWIARQRVRHGARIKDLAPVLGISESALASAVRGKTWRHVADPVMR